MQDMDVIEPQARVVEFRGERLEIRPLTIGAVPGLVRASRPVINSLLDAAWITDGAAFDAQSFDGALDLIEQHGEAVVQGVALAIGRDAKWVASGDISEFIDLTVAVLEVNRDFFTRRIAPLLGGRAAPWSGAGATASSS